MRRNTVSTTKLNRCTVLMHGRHSQQTFLNMKQEHTIKRKKKKLIIVHWLVKYISLSKRLNQHRNTLSSLWASLWSFLRGNKMVHMFKWHKFPQGDITAIWRTTSTPPCASRFCQFTINFACFTLLRDIFQLFYCTSYPPSSHWFLFTFVLC